MPTAKSIWKRFSSAEPGRYIQTPGILILGFPEYIFKREQRFMRHLKLFAAVLIGILFTGCAEPVIFSEVFQQSENQKIYTAYNLWYTDPLNMDSLNIQQGSFIPLGTEIEPLSTSSWSDSIEFKDLSTGKIHSIKFSQAERLCTMRSFISYTFTTSPKAELLKGVPEDMKARVIRGQVVPGMNQKAVQLAYGPPPACRTPDLKLGTWIYWRTPDDAIRIVFRDDKVRTILNIGQER